MQRLLTQPLARIAHVRAGYPKLSEVQARAVDTSPPRALPFGLLQAGDLRAAAPIAWDGLRPVHPTRTVEPYVIRDGDVIVPLRSARPTTVVARRVPASVLAADSLALCTVATDTVVPEFLAWYLNHPVLGLDVDRLTQGSNLKFIPLAALRSVEIALPPLAVQRRIARAAGLHARTAELEGHLADARARLVDALTLSALRRAGAGHA